ncbi:MAG: SPOR domain-containing protein [Vicingaceae bacterium]|nr:SPOR domain-containing protein [Vicingaceae bacterium]
MIKQLFLIVNFVSIFFYQLFFTSDVTVKQNMPASIQPKGEVEVELVITKADIAGFAKIQQEIPEGFTVEPLETAGATFSFKEQKLKLIWMALPQNGEFSIKYKLKNVSHSSGKYTITGKFSYIVNNERMNVDIPTANITVSSEELVAEETESTSNTEDEESRLPATNNTATALSASRSIENVGDNKFKVILNINKENVEGFAKLSEFIPAGFSASNNNSAGGVFSVENNEVKVLWLSVPSENNFEVSYFIESNSASGLQEISGVLSYLKGEETQKHQIASTSFSAAGESLAINDNEDEEETSLQNKVDNIVEEDTEDDVVVDNTEEETKRTAPVTNTPAPEKNVTYKVQVGAFREGITIEKYQKKFKLNDQINLENHQGWTKLITGSFTEYKSARDKRNNLRNKVKTAFVTAYNQGERITVQEALMITNQKWVQ